MGKTTLFQKPDDEEEETKPEAPDTDAAPEEPPLEEGPPTPEVTMQEGGDDEGDGYGSEAICRAIRKGMISIKDFAKIREAMEVAEAVISPTEDLMTEATPDTDMEPPLAPDMVPVPAASPGAAMSKQTTKREAVLMARLKANDDRITAMEEAAAVEKDVAEAVETLGARFRGEDPVGELTAFRKGHGAQAFKAYVKELDSRLSPVTGDRHAHMAAMDVSEPLPDEVMAFEKDGPEAVEKAARFSKQYDELKKARMVRMSRERYVALAMDDEKFSR